MMAQPLDPKDLVTIEDLAISSMWEVAALVEVQERKGVLTRQERHTDLLHFANSSCEISQSARSRNLFQLLRPSLTS